MILRPPDDELVDTIADVCLDFRLSADTRCMIAMLLACRDLDLCPKRAVVADMCGIGQYRINRVLEEAKSAGYMQRATWRMPRPGRRAAYTFVVGPPHAVSKFVEAQG